MWVLLVAATGLLIFAGASLPHLDADDIFYGDIARDILACRDWLTLSHPNRPHWLVDKPPLSFWLMALSIRVAGDNQIALRLWHLLMALVTMFVTFRIARLAGEREEALLAALLLGTCLEFAYLSLNPKQDVPLSLFLALAFYAYLRYRSAGATASAVLCGLWMALAVLTKGIVALAAFVPVVAADLLIPRSARGEDGGGYWRWEHVAAGVAAFLFVGAPWFVVGAIRQGRPFIDTFFLGGSLGVGRFFHGVFAPMPYSAALVAHIPMIMVGLIPWAGFLPGAVQQAWRSVRAGRLSARICALWAGSYFLMLSLSPGDKMIHHLLPIFVPTAVLAARTAIDADGHRRRLRVPAMIALFTAVLAAVFAVRAQINFPAEADFFRPLLLPVMVLGIGSLVLFAVFAFRGAARMAIAVAAVALLLAYGTSGWILVKYPTVPLGPSGIRAVSPSCVTRSS